jgi:exosortase D (VPLPA-CTERM-specific)
MSRDLKTSFSPSLSLIAGAGLLGAVLWFYWPVLTNMLGELAKSDDESYGLLLPLVSGYVFYLKWPQLRRQQWRPSWAGLAVMALGLVLFMVGELAAELFTTRFSFVVVLTGVVVLVGGRRLFRLLAFPLLLLALMLPLPELITNKLTLPLQLVSSRLATGILQFSGIPVLRQGNIIDLGVRQLEVAAACSGLRYILPLLALGIIYCYFYQRRPWKVAVLFITLIPATILVNALRVTGMAIFPSLVIGFWHAFTGWLIFLFCLSSLALINWTLNRLWPQAAVTREDMAELAGMPAESQEKLLWPYLLAAFILMVLAGPLVHYEAKAPPVPIRQSFDNFPMELGPWQGQHTFIDPEMVEATRSDAHLSADYLNPGQAPVSLWIAYYDTQKKAGGFVHSPKGCLPASGWQITDEGIYQIRPHISVNYMVTNKMGARIVVFYWFLQRGRWLTSEYLNKLYMGYDGLLRRRTDGAIIRLVTPAGKDVAAAKERLAAFTNLMIPVLPEFIPN